MRHVFVGAPDDVVIPRMNRYGLVGRRSGRFMIDRAIRLSSETFVIPVIKQHAVADVHAGHFFLLLRMADAWECRSDNLCACAAKRHLPTSLNP